MRTVATIDEARRFVGAEGMHLLYMSRPGCGVCGAIRPKVELMLEEYPAVEAGYLDLDQIPEAAGEFSIFTVPAILVYIDGRETIREARYISMDLLEERIARPYRLRFSE